MLNINLDDVAAEATKKFEARSYEDTPAGVYPMQVAASKSGEAFINLVKQTEGEETFYTLSAFYRHSEAKGLNGVTYKVDILGSKTVTSRETGEVKTIDLRSNLKRFLLNYGFSDAELKGANVSLSALDDVEALDSAGWKGVPTDISINGQSIVSRLTSTVVNAIVKQGKKKPYIAAISAS